MATDNIVTIHAGRLSLSRITYHCDLQRASGQHIPLGVIAEMKLGPVRVLGLIARTGLTGDETSQIARLLREHLARPFEYLKAEFDWAWSNVSGGESLAALSNRHAEALFFAPPAYTSVRRPFTSGGDLDSFKRELCDARDAEFKLMLAELRGNLELAPGLEESTKLAA
jgi:hypothetical protein